ncbi:MAG: hypothetical protein A2808_00550 [Candidatus Moranbacteria bacterium RIFCSPHIGHO2_01_FULL_55_24]|nr:MAG: hypothetical protein A2808_00550 [Candidatus Moranbacteria bacterium RIFCSPHIGHO2_01_FULL_55_24]
MGIVLRSIAMLGLTVAYASTYGQALADPVKQTICEVAPNLSVNTFRVPQGAIWKDETIREKNTPGDYSAVVGWINAATVLPCAVEGSKAEIEIRSIKVIEQNIETGEEKTVREVSFGNDRKGFEGGLFKRLPEWFGPGEGDHASKLESLKDHALRISLEEASQNVYHGWTAPRAETTPGTRHIVEVEARIAGAARLQLGLDYWRDLEVPYNGYDEKCQASNNCEAWISEWYGDTDGEFATLRAPGAFAKK